MFLSSNELSLFAIRIKNAHVEHCKLLVLVPCTIISGALIVPFSFAIDLTCCTPDLVIWFN